MDAWVSRGSCYSLAIIYIKPSVVMFSGLCSCWIWLSAKIQVWCPIFTSSLRYTCGCGVRSSTFVCVSAFVSHRQTVCCSTVGRHGRLGRSRFRSASLPPPCSRPSPPSRFEKYHSKDDYAESWISILVSNVLSLMKYILAGSIQKISIKNLCSYLYC